MKYLIIICMLFTSCSVFKKSVNTQKQDVSKSLLKFTDSAGYKKVDSSSHSLTTGSTIVKVDSGYDKVTEEYINEYTDSIAIHRETKRVIKEKGQKRVEQSSSTTRYDSASSMISEHSQLKEIEEEDSTATTDTVQKDVKRSTSLRWWLWLALVPVAVVFLVWKRNPIIEFLKPNNKS